MLGNKIPVSPDIAMKEVSLDQIVFSLFPNLKCMNCGMYRRNYHCIPVTYTKGKEMLSNFDHICLLIIQRTFQERIDHLTPMISNPYLVLRHACTAEVQVMKRLFNNYLSKLRTWSIATKQEIVLYGYGGGCRACRKCALYDKVSCRHPGHTFRAPESTGVDVYATLQKLGIAFEIIPKSLVTLVGLIAYGSK